MDLKQDCSLFVPQPSPQFILLCYDFSCYFFFSVPLFCPFLILLPAFRVTKIGTVKKNNYDKISLLNQCSIFRENINIFTYLCKKFSTRPRILLIQIRILILLRSFRIFFNGTGIYFQFSKKSNGFVNFRKKCFKNISKCLHFFGGVSF